MGLEKKVTFSEYNAIRKSWNKSLLKVAICYPNVYRAGMAGLTVQQLYYLFNLDDEVLCERCFLSKNPKTVESSANLKAFDVVAFTLQYEEDYMNALRMLINSGINPLADARPESDPLIIAGGQAVSANPLPLSRIFDCIFIGELEPELQMVLDALKGRRTKSSRLRELCELDCIYHPGKNYVKRSVALNLDETPHITSQIMPCLGEALVDPVFSSSSYVEISRSCGRRCRFCLVSWTNGPFRFRSFSKTLELVDLIVQRSAGKRITLLGAGISDVPHLKDICNEISGKGLELSIPSLRPDAIDPELLELMKRGGQKTLALGVESLSGECREFLGKPYDDDVLENVVEMAVDEGLAEVKLYLIACLPRENLETVKPLLQRLFNFLSKGKTVIHFSVNPLIPKPNTPFQWLQPPRPSTVKSCYSRLSKALRHPKAKAHFLNPYRALVQALLSLGNDILGLRLLKAIEGSPLNWRLTSKILSSAFVGVKAENPWDIIDLGYDKGMLRASFERAMQLLGLHM